MSIYIFSEIVFFILSFLENKRNCFVVFIACTILLFVIFGLHNGQFNGAADYHNYLDFFIGKGSMYGELDYIYGYDLERPYYYFCKFLRLFGKPDYVYIWGYAFVVGIPLLIMLKKYSKNYALSCFCFLTIMTSQMVVFVMHAHRQMIATTAFVIAFLIYVYIKKNIMWSFRKKLVLYLIVIFLLWLSIVGHSSSYFVIPLVLCLMALENRKLYTKRGLIVVLAVSLPLGFLFSSTFSSVANVLMNAFSGYEALERTTHYLVENVYGDAKASVVKHSLQTLTAIAFVIYAKENEIHQLFLRCFCLATIVNVFFTNGTSRKPFYDIVVYFGLHRGCSYDSKRNGFSLGYYDSQCVYVLSVVCKSGI